MMGACSSHPFIHPILSLPPSSAAFFYSCMLKMKWKELLAIFFYLALAFFLFIKTYTAGIIKTVVRWSSFLKLARWWSPVELHFGVRIATNILWFKNLSSKHHTGEYKKRNLLCLFLSAQLDLVVGVGSVTSVVLFRAAERAVKLDSIVMPPSEQFSSIASKSPHTLHQYYCNSLALGYFAAAVPHWQIPFVMPSLSPQPESHWFFFSLL